MAPKEWAGEGVSPIKDEPRGFHPKVPPALAMVTEERDQNDAGPAGAGWLVARARAGDREAFARLIEDNYDFIFRVACKLCGRRTDAEDIAQEVCVKLATAIAAFDGRSAFTSWLYTITLNSVRDHVRAEARRGRKHDALGYESSEETAGDQDDAVMRSELWAAVRTLPEQQREAVFLVYAEELSHAEAGEVMGIREGTVSSHIHDARKTLRGLL